MADPGMMGREDAIADSVRPENAPARRKMVFSRPDSRIPSLPHEIPGSVWDGKPRSFFLCFGGEQNFMMKAFGLFMDFDKMTGTDFEKGLANLKTVVAKQ